MTEAELIEKTTARLEAIMTSFSKEVSQIRTDRAHPDLVAGLLVETPNGNQPLNQIATIVAPEATTIQVRPFDRSLIKAIVDSVRANEGLGLSPTDNGQIVYLTLPPLTTERRHQIATRLSQKQEAGLIRLRQSRHEILKSLKDMDWPQTTARPLTDKIEKLFDQSKKEIEALTAAKRREIIADGN